MLILKSTQYLYCGFDNHGRHVFWKRPSSTKTINDMDRGEILMVNRAKFVDDTSGCYEDNVVYYCSDRSIRKDLDQSQTIPTRLRVLNHDWLLSFHCTPKSVAYTDALCAVDSVLSNQ
jgi:hypothetical protein